MPTINGKDQSILFQVAFKAAIELVGKGEDAAAIFQKTYEFYDFLAGEHGYNVKPVAHVTGDTVEVDPSSDAEAVRTFQDAFPGSTVEDVVKQPRRVTPPNMAQSSGQQGYEFKNQKGPIPSWFWSNKNVQGNPGIKVWYDERDDNGDVVVAASGNFRPAFKSVIAKGADRDSQLAVFPPKNG